jgi:hypothetical protein
MTQVLIVHAAADAARAQALAAALRTHGLTVAGEPALPGDTPPGPPDRVVALWSKAAAGAGGALVRAQAAWASAAATLISACLDSSPPPPGLNGAVVSLAAWRGAAGHPAIVSLAALCQGAGETAADDQPRSRLSGLARRSLTGSAVAALLAGLWAATSNVANYQGYLCSAPVGQPAVSDICGAVGAGGKPTHDERLAWAARKPGDCDALRNHIARFPGGVYRSAAADLLQGATLARATSYSPAPRSLRGYVRQSEHPFASVDAARVDAVQRAKADAQTACQPADAFERLAGADISPGAFDCRPGPAGGQACALDYAATCRIETRAMVERCG